MSSDAEDYPTPPEDEGESISHEDDLWAPGHRACAGCGPALAMKHITDVTGEKTIVANSTGCMEVVSTPFPESSWGTSYIHDVFANAPSVASGYEAAYRAFDDKGYDEYLDHDEVTFLVMAGDGASFDIGIRALSGMMERGHDVLYVAYDNEAYMNTGIQRSSATPYGAETTTSPPGEESIGNDTNKKDMPAIAAAHGCDYVATASIGHVHDLKNKVEKAMEHDGPKYLQVFSPCPLGWEFDSAQTVNMAELAVETGFQPLFEMEYGEITDVHTVRDRKPVTEYLEKQGRFDHLTGDDKQEAMAQIQAYVDERAEDLGIDPEE